MKKIVVLGALGMAGHIMAEYLQGTEEFQVIGVARNSGRYVDKVLDVLDFEQLEQYLAEVKADIVVNCIGALVSNSRDNIAKAILINSYLPHFLVDLGNKMDFKLIHISTDCVFSGKDGRYAETAFRDGDDNYARSKALGEVFSDSHLTIRTSIIGPELKTNGTGLLDWFFKQKGEINGFSQAYWSGVTTLELAKATYQFIHQGLTGLYQLCPESKISKRDLLEHFNTIWGRGCLIKSVDDYTVDKSLVCTRKDFVYTRPNYLPMLQDLKDWTDTRADYYSHYKL